MSLKDNTIYNRANNEVYVKSEGDLIYVICNIQSQQDIVVQKMTTKNCILDSYEEWDEGDDMKWILIFKILDEFDIKPELN